MGMGAILLLKEAALVLLPIAIAVTLTFVLARPVQHLGRLGVPAPWGAGLVIVLLLLVIGMLCLTLAAPAAQWVERAPTTLQQLLKTLEHLRDVLLPHGVHRSAAYAAQPEADALKDKLASEGLLFTRVVIGQFLRFALSAAATVILLYFLLASQHWLLSRTVEVARQPRTRVLLLSGIRQAQREIGLYLGTMTLINIGLGVFTGLALALIGLPNPLLWGTVVAVLNFVPYLGPALLTGMLVLAGSMTFGTGSAMLAPSAAFLLCHVIEANIVSPWVQGYRLRLSPLAVFLSVMVWGWTWGFGGTLVATPILLGFRAFCRRHKRFKHVCFYLEGARQEAPSLRALLRVEGRANVAPLQPRRRRQI